MAPLITGVEVIAAGPPMPEVQFTEALPEVFTTVTYAVVTDDTGRAGIGAVESDSFGAFDLGPLEALRTMAPAVLGEDPLQPGAIAALARSRKPSASRAVPVAALEVACWDLVGRHAGVPLHQLVGGARDEVPAYASLPFERDPATLDDLMRRVCSDGYRAVKLHVSGDPEADVASVAEVRRSHPDVEVIVDAESVYDLAGALRVGRALDDLGCLWFEAPLPDRDVAGYTELARTLATPMVPAGGLVDDPAELALILPARPWAALRTQTMEGGVDHVREFAALGAAYGLDLQLCSYGTTVTQVTDLQLILGLGLGGYYEQPFPVEPWAFGATTALEVVDGKVRAPDGPGLGLELDRDVIDRATIGRFETAI
ncbi:mandelate racemase/muconate lactonizing enzyme family protein [Nocardioides bigeumensis]|uniref:glucarate dehydratase n=1 Tax=Nocardioides bigeumensis TaxID=433657 RepID=A0ABN2YZX3_9ACTN